MIVYAESSAVLRWLLGAPGGAAVFASLRAAHGIGASRLTLAEVRRVVTRFEAAGRLATAVAGHCRALLTAELPRWDILELSDGVWLRAEERFPVEPIRTIDALHIRAEARRLGFLDGTDLLLAA